MVKLFITWVCICLATVMFAQDIDSPVVDSTLSYTDIPKNDEPFTIDTTLSQYNFITNDDSIKSYGTKRDYPYMLILDSALRVIGKLPVDTIDINGAAVMQKPAEGKTKLPVSGFPVSPIFRLLLWIAAISFLGYIVYILFAKGSIFIRNKVMTSSTVTSEEHPADAGDFESRIAQSVLNKNYRLAIRYMYLKTLYTLASANLIAIAPGKTNDQYIREMSRHPGAGYKDFKALTSSYEYVWYGKFMIDQPAFERIEKAFKNYHNIFKN